MGSSSACWTATVLAHDHPQLRMLIHTALPRAGAHLLAVVGTANPPLPTAVVTSRAGVSHRFVHNSCGHIRRRAAAQNPSPWPARHLRITFRPLNRDKPGAKG